MWIEGRNHTLLNLDEVLCFELQKEMEGSIPTNQTRTNRRQQNQHSIGDP